MSYLLKKSKELIPINKTLNLMFLHINNYKSLKKMRVLEIGIGNGVSSIPMSKEFKSYYGIEPTSKIYEIFIEFCIKNNCSIKSYNVDFEQFTNNYKSKKKFDLVILRNVIHFIGYDDLIRLSKRIVKTNAFILIQNSQAKPVGWGNKKFVEDSLEFNEAQWLKYKSQLEKTYNDLSGSKYLDKFEKDDMFNYFLFKTNNQFT
jgi:16S rRNA G527 N7-methylase RsmG